MRVAFIFRGALRYANRGDNEAPAVAVARSLSRRLETEITLWPNGTDNLQRACWIARYFDPGSETFQEHAVYL